MLCSCGCFVFRFRAEGLSRGRRLSQDEKVRIMAQHECGKSARAIARDMGRSADVVARFLRDPEGYSTQNHKRLITDRAIRRLINEAAKGEKSAERLREEHSISLSTRRVQQILSSSSFLNYEKRKPAPWMTKRHYDARVEWAKLHTTVRTNWDEIIFSDENLNGKSDPYCVISLLA
jgi:IS30 family transposase